MKKQFIIRDLIQTNYADKPLYFIGYYTNGFYGSITDARKYDTFQEAEWGVEALVKEEKGYFTIDTIYSPLN